MIKYIDESKSLITNQNHNQTQIKSIIQASKYKGKPKLSKIIDTREREKNKAPYEEHDHSSILIIPNEKRRGSVTQ